MKCIVTGGAGFIGSHIVDLLLEHEMDVTVLDNLSSGVESNLNPKATFHRLDVCDGEALAPLCRDVDLFFHTAALPRIQPSFDQPVEHEEANVIATIRCLQAVAKSHIKKFIFSSSCAIYGTAEAIPTLESAPPRPPNPYALQKYAAEQYCLILGRHLNIPVVALRYFNVYGPRSYNQKNPFNAYTSVVGIFAKQKKAGGPLTITGDGGQSRDFVHVHDVAQANLEAALSNKSLEVYNVGTGVRHTINQVAGLFSTPVTYISERQGEALHVQADISKIQREIGWRPRVSLEEGIATVLE